MLFLDETTPPLSLISCGLQQHKLILLQLWRSEVQIESSRAKTKVLVGLVPSKSPRGESVSYHFQLLEAAGISWLMAATLSSPFIIVSSHPYLPPSFYDYLKSTWKIQDHLPISISLMSSHLQSPFCHIK
jgi:hypothetical protein